ncbi:glycosyl transferase family 36, partial [Bdellovibrionota bacterium FG-1]
VSEAIYIRDEATGEFWSPTPLPIREPETYFVRHGQGYSQFEHSSHGIAQVLHISVPLDASVKISRLRLKNLGNGIRHLSVTSYVEWVLGFQRGVTAPTMITEIDDKTGAIFARNPYNNEFAPRVAFAEMVEERRTLTCDRKEFLGRNGNTARPAALRRKNLSGTAGAGLDPCAAFQTSFTLRPGEERELIILLGQAENAESAQELIVRYRKKDAAKTALAAVLTYWNETLGAIEIKTPDASMNTLVNRWLLYQALSCRIWARSGFYQSGGAIGFRDQLQDVMALVYSRPELARQQILTAAARQFEEGDVQHWWHPPTGRGVRTHFSDDLLWLPFVTSFYIKVTGDASVLEEPISFIDAPELEPGQDDSYLMPRTSSQLASIFEHCARALDRSLKTGSHGLPLMGSGDWNDGMNRVGHRGQGESVWVGWFLHQTLSQFIPFCEKAGQTERATIYQKHLEALKTAIEANAWDGEWYRRAFFDDGSPLGSSTNDECQIDSIAQSWAVLSRAGDPERARLAMKSVNERLVHRGDGLVKLFVPPFDQGNADPGYIKGYVPGVRENGGQYTHAAIWALMAYAAQGDGDRAAELFSMLNPINHANTRAKVNRYKVEPYVMAGDIYGLSPHIGRGGWTWYTGSASWMYRAALESILGFELRGNVFRIQPCLPKHWPGFEMTYRPKVGSTTQYLISVTQTTPSTPSIRSIRLDGVLLDSADIPIADDGKMHTVQIQI